MFWLFQQFAQCFNPCIRESSYNECSSWTIILVSPQVCFFHATKNILADKIFTEHFIHTYPNAIFLSTESCPLPWPFFFSQSLDPGWFQTFKP